MYTKSKENNLSEGDETDAIIEGLRKAIIRMELQADWYNKTIDAAKEAKI